MDELTDTVETYAAVADEYESRHRDRGAVAHLVERFDDAVGSGLVLDVGCGPGWESATFADLGYDVVAVDLTEQFVVRTADRVPDAGVVRADMRHLPVATDSVDGVWACASFLHVPRADAASTLAAFARVLRPGGSLLLSVKRGDGTMAGDGYEQDTRRFTLYRPDELRSLLAAAGFDPSVRADADWVTALASR